MKRIATTASLTAMIRHDFRAPRRLHFAEDTALHDQSQDVRHNDPKSILTISGCQVTQVSRRDVDHDLYTII